MRFTFFRIILKLVNYHRFCVLHTRASWIIFISLHSRHPLRQPFAKPPTLFRSLISATV